MDRVKEISVRYEQGGGDMCGKILMWSALVTCTILFLSPMFLKSETYGTGVTSQWINETKAAVFPMMPDTPMIENVGEYC